MALKTLREHPEPLRSGEDCKKLKNFGAKICEKIDKEFAKLNNCGDRLPKKSAVSNSQLNSPQRAISDILPIAVRAKRPLMHTPKQSTNVFTKDSPQVKVIKT
ncbi:hypothetical protein BLA29_013494, partial [Euroglyphus maynei]